MTEYVEKTCAACKKKFNFEWIGYVKGGRYYCGRENCPSNPNKGKNKV